MQHSNSDRQEESATNRVEVIDIKKCSNENEDSGPSHEGSSSETAKLTCMQSRDPDVNKHFPTSKNEASYNDEQCNSISNNQNFKQGEKSPSESTSGLVSPSSCSVSSQESQNLKNCTATEDSKSCKNDEPIIGQDTVLQSTSHSSEDETTAPLHATSSTIDKHQPRISKTPRKRPTGRRRSNSVPMYSVIGSTNAPAADSSLSSITISSSKGSSRLRRGKWTVEEETYVARVIQDFNNGFLDAPAGTTLRTYLSDKLNCDPMRITKKFTGDACIGKRVFHPAVRCATSASMIDRAQSELESLERRWRRRLDMQKKDADKKQAASVAASAAAAAAAAASAPHLHDPTSALIRLNASALPGNRVVVTRTASWLDRANAILSKRRMANEQLSKKPTQGDEVKKEMQEVEKLIQEGPIIQKSSGLLLQKHSNDSNEPCSKRKVSDDHGDSKALPNPRSLMIRQRQNPQDLFKRMRKSQSANNLDLAPDRIRVDFNLSTGEAEDAASFIGFISSVREEAASGVPNPSEMAKK